MRNTVRQCNAKQSSDSVVCHRCNLVWDVNDPTPPSCKSDEELNEPVVINVQHYVGH